MLALPSTAEHSVANEGGSGLSRLARAGGASLVLSASDLGRLDPSKYVLVLSEGDRSRLPIDSVAEFVRDGGVVVAWYGRYSLELAERLGAPLRVSGAPVLDEVAKYGDRFTPLAFLEGNASGPAFALRRPRALESAPPGVACLLATSPFSFLDEDGDGLYQVGERMGSFCVAVEVESNRGALVLFLSENSLANDLFDANRAVLGLLAPGRGIAVDQSVQAENPLELLKILGTRAEFKWAMLDALVALSTALGVVIAREVWG